MNSPVFVTQSALPKEETYLEYVRQIFQSHGLTNNGVFCQRLERELEAFLGVRNLSVCSNGTLALQLAIKMLGINGKKVITTPFTYVATVTALMWENCEPILRTSIRKPCAWIRPEWNQSCWNSRILAA